MQDNNSDIYGQLGKLCDNLYRKYQPYNDEDYSSTYLLQQDNKKQLRRLRTKAYEILLNKSSQDYSKEREPCDPIMGLLKFAYVLKVGAGRVSQAAELNRYLSEFIEEKLDQDSTTYLTLQFLNCLKSLDFEEEDSSLDVFYYDKPHPQLPEMLCDQDDLTPFQVYPIESFYLPNKFEKAFRKEQSEVIRYNATKPGSRFALLDKFTSNRDQHFQPKHGSSDIMLTNVPYHTNSLPNEMNLALSSYFVPQIKDTESTEERFQSSKEVIVTYPESPWQQLDSTQWFAQNSINYQDNQIRNYEIEDNKIEEQTIHLDEIWEEMDKESLPLNHRTWETLGLFHSQKEPPFASESINVTEHLINVAQDNIIIPGETSLMQLRNEITIKAFIADAILLLLGIESNTFVHSTIIGFELKKNIFIHGIHCITLENLCQDIIRWGTCFRNLSDMIVPDPQTGKLQVDGLIFEALCNSVKEFLLFYHAAILRVSKIKYEDVGILQFLHKISPLGNLILQVAELCRCDSQRTTSLGRGIGILTHIYKEVTKVTQKNVALVFYSILKDCCEVYFRFLQQWIFEGSCFDIYEEFMIRIKPQYLRIRGHRFWTQSFRINHSSVPGFLSDLTDTILQCGKAVALLKICNPQHPLCQASASCQPPIRVCLSVNMLREQMKFYEDYRDKGKIEQDDEYSLYTAIHEQKESEKKRAELVITAQQNTLQRLKKEREDALTKRAEEKNKLLKQLKDQVEQAALRKEKNRESELIADKLLLDEILKQEEEAKIAERVERENTIKYYNDLAEEAERRRIHAEWRIRRMKLFDERVTAIASSRREFINTPDESKSPNKFPQSIVESKIEQLVEKTNSTVQENDNVVAMETSVQEVVPSDENSNLKSAEEKPASTVETKPIGELDEQNKNITVPIKRAVRPTVLDLTNVNDRLDGLLSLRETDNMIAAQRNKLKVLQQEYGITPNNNESAAILLTMEKSLQTELQENRLRNTQHIAWDVGETTKRETLNEMTEIHTNRLKNTQHLNWNYPEVTSISPKEHVLTAAEINRNKVMSHFYNRPEDAQENSQKNDKLTECQKNRNKNMAHSIEHFTFDNGREQDNHFKETPMSTNTDQFTVSSSMPAPSFGDTPFSEITNNSDMLFARSSSDNISSDGASTHGRSGVKHFQDTPALPNFIGFGSLPNTPSTESQQLTVADVEMIDATSLQVFLEKSVIVPLTVQSYLVNNALIKYLLNEHNMLSHLHSLRSFFFLLNGEFTKTLSYSLFTRLYQISQPAELFNSSTLSNFLEKALVSSLSGTYANSELLSLSATEVPTYLQTSNPEILSCLSLNYKISWPLNIIFNEIVMQQYSRVFKFLLMVGRVLWVLQEDFHILKMERKASITKNHHKLQLYRHSMMQFMNALHTYLTCSVLHASWSEFEKELENAKTIDEVYDTHVSYIKKILSRCMLNVRGEKMRTCLTNIFKVVLKFHNRIRAQNWNDPRSLGPNYENIEKMYVAFCEQRAYLAHVADKLANSGYQPHLMQFLHALNINQHYDLTAVIRK
ncbi:gamma-tubulin complex component 6 isoform X1 [Phymastichus coffea]|uniref:gamma-tubulin complex component 6 isoform X1 n=1 Tax=Phymastichus coffea TaxID=108790 RepID=UPI00273BC752|nr:gamma-tubulin complex component 6 isoform X1 [Phymastichus coffea]